MGRPLSNPRQALPLFLPFPPPQPRRLRPPTPATDCAALPPPLAHPSPPPPPPPTPHPDGTATPPDSKATILSREARDALLLPFLQILKDLAAGVPTAADDLVSLLDGRND